MVWPKGKKRSTDLPLKVKKEDLNLFLRIWDRESILDLQGLSSRTKGNYDFHISIVPFIFFLWCWALENRKITLEQALIKCWSQLQELFHGKKDIVSDKPISPPTLLQARQNLGIDIPFAMLNNATERVFERFDEMTRWKGLRVYAVDGSNLNLPRRKELVEEFGHHISGDKEAYYPQAQFVTLELLNMGWIVDYVLDHCYGSELDNAKQLSERLGMNDLMIADRLYFDPAWFKELTEKGTSILVRLASNRYQSLIDEDRLLVELNRIEGDTIDIDAELKVKSKSGGKPGSLLPVRYIEIPREDNETLRFLTTLPRSLASIDEIQELYKQRWGIETDYRIFKGPDHLPDVASRKVSTVEQEIIFRVLAHNSVRWVQAEACELARQEELVEEKN
jgi:hypothetical protein